MAGSPFFLKNFMYTLGHFDIYGCAFAICLLLVPARSIAFVLLAAAGSMILILIYHIHFLMYVPTIAAIAVLRYYLLQGLSRQDALVGLVSVAAIGLLFVAAQFRGSMAVPDADFVNYLQSRMADPSRTRLAELQFHLVPLIGSGNRRYLGPHAEEFAVRSGVRAVGLAACPGLEIFWRFDPIALA